MNNTETFSQIAWIIRHGSKAFSDIGTEDSTGTKVFALAGKIARGGLIEVPMGITLRQVVDDIGGGVANGYDPAIKIDGKALTEGYIGLQSEGQGVEFREIKIKKLN